MGINGNGGKRNGWIYNKKTLKASIENNQFVRNTRKKLMEGKLRKKLQK